MSYTVDIILTQYLFRLNKIYMFIISRLQNCTQESFRWFNKYIRTLNYNLIAMNEFF